MRHRQRTTIKWSTTVLTVLLLIGWIASARRAAGIDHTPQFGHSVIGGRVTIGWIESANFPPRSTEWYGPVKHEAPFRWWFQWQRSTCPTSFDLNGYVPGPMYTRVACPLWLIVLLLGLPTARLWWRDSRPRPVGLCLNCNYDLRGADHSVCPECGHG